MARRTVRPTVAVVLTALMTALVTALLLTGAAGSADAGRGTPGRASAHPPAAAASADQTINILVLGDSYSAGNGSTDDQGNGEYYGPSGCYRSKVDWAEKYAATLRQQGYRVSLTNHACSGAVTADFTNPRVLDTTSNQTTQNSTGATTNDQANAYLAQTDPCNTHQFPDEQFWTYQTTLLTPATITYDCDRDVRPQANFVTPQTDLLLYTMGGNDIGFSSIVTNCFVPAARTASGCKGAVDNARSLLPAVQQRLLAALTYLRGHGLRDDAKVVQLGYPRLQVDNNYTLTDATGTYDAGNEVRSLSDEGDALIAATVPTANVGHPGQVSFLGGVPEKFAGHEPDATTPTGNPDRWINQVGDGTTTVFWYHPNRFGQQAYADLLTAHGTFGAPTSANSGPAEPVVKATVKVRQAKRHGRAAAGDRIRLRIKIKLSNHTRPHGRIIVRGLPGKHVVVRAKVRRHQHGVVRVTLRTHGTPVRRVKVSYRDKAAVPFRRTYRLHHGS